MPSRDVAQLILEVDARIATAQRAVNQLARSVQQDSASMEQSLGKVATAHANLGKAMNDNGRVRAGFTQLSFQIGDITQQMSLGVSGARIFAQQSGQVIQALQVMGGEGNKFLQFMGGPWGIAISTAAVILAPLASKLFDTGDEVGKLVDKMREQAKQAALNAQADEVWKHTIEGLTEAIRKRREEQEKALQTDILTEQDSLTQARNDITESKSQLAKAIADQRKAEADRDRARQALNAAASSPGADEATVRGASAALDSAQTKVDSIVAQVNALQIAVFNAEGEERAAQAKITQRAVEDKYDKTKAASDAYTRTLGTLNRELTRGALTLDEYNKRLDAARAKLQAAKDAAKDSSANRQFGRQISFSQAEAIARAGGLQVNSGYRSVADQARLFNDPSVNRPGNPVARPGTSAHNGANGKWAIDIQITDGVTPGKIRKIFADQGVSLSKVLKENGHFHVEGSRSEAAKAENDAQRAADKQLRNDNAFAEQRDRLNQELLAAQSQLVQGIAAQAAMAEDRVKGEQQRRDAAIQNDVAEGKLTQAQADQLKAINASIAAEKIKGIETGKQIELIRQQSDDQQRVFQYRLDDLRFADEMARTQAEKRRIELDILDALYAQKKAELEAAKAAADKAGNTRDAANAQAALDRLPTEKAHDQARTLHGTMSPLEAWADQARKSAADISEAFESIEVHALDGLADAITGVIMGTKSLGAAFSDMARSIIADIIQMTVKMLIFRAISSIFGGGIGSPSFGGFDVGVSTGNTLFAGGASIPHFDNGGLLTVGGMGGVDRNLLSINGVPRAMVSGDEQLAVIPRAPRLGNMTAANSNGGGPIEIVITTAPSEDAWAKVDSIASHRAGQGAQVSIRHTDQTIRGLQRPKLMGR